MPVEAIGEWNRALDALADAIGLPIVTPALRAIDCAARAVDGAAKPSGAGGGDLAVCFTSVEAVPRLRAQLVREGYVAQRPGPQDRRQRLLELTPKGSALERQLTETQARRLLRAFRAAETVGALGKKDTAFLVGGGGQFFHCRGRGRGLGLRLRCEGEARRHCAQRHELCQAVHRRPPTNVVYR